MTDVVHVALVEKHAAKQSPSRIEELVNIFIQATRVRLAYLLLAKLLLLTRAPDGDWVLGHGFDSVNSDTGTAMEYRQCCG
jgi:hypothetical protein